MRRRSLQYCRERLSGIMLEQAVLQWPPVHCSCLSSMSFSWMVLSELYCPLVESSATNNNTQHHKSTSFRFLDWIYVSLLWSEKLTWMLNACVVGLTCGSSAQGSGSTATPERQSLWADERWLQRCPSSATAPSPPPPNESAHSDSTLPKTAHLSN